jgi:hypothetical protein
VLLASEKTFSALSRLSLSLTEFIPIKIPIISEVFFHKFIWLKHD